MITPRRTRLVRVADLHQFRIVVSALAASANAAKGVIVVPTRGAAAAMRATCAQAEISVHRFVTRDGLYDTFHRSLADAPRRLAPFEREAIGLAAAEEAAHRVGDLPFQVRPGLIRELLAFYDTLGRQSQSIDRFETLISDALSGGDGDRGAERLIRQTQFLAEAFRGYQRRVAASGACDEHVLRALLTNSTSSLGVGHVVVTTADWIADPAGLFAADFDLLTRVPGLERLDLVCTSAVLASGFHERIHQWWPGLEEIDGRDVAAIGDSPRPRLVRPPIEGDRDTLWFTHRDRHEELAAVASRLAAGDRRANDRSAIVYKRPLPYLYLAPETLEREGVPYRVNDALPFAAEPVVATIDLLLELVESDWSRDSLVAVLRSPHLRAGGPGSAPEALRGGRAEDSASEKSGEAGKAGATAPWLPFDEVPATEPTWRASIAALNRLLSERRYLGGRDRLAELAAEHGGGPAAGAFAAAVGVVARLAPLAERRTASAHLEDLRQFLTEHDVTRHASDPLAERETRARARLIELLRGLGDAHRLHHDPVWSIDDLAASLRRWIGEETFDVTSGHEGVFLLDDQSARYGCFDELTIVGLIENEWPDKPRRNIFYSAPLLKTLGWPSERDRRAGADARFLELLASPSSRIELSTFSLDDETIVARSVLLDEVGAATLSTDAQTATATEREPHASPWDGLRDIRLPADDARFHGTAGTRAARPWSVSALETYLGCPFRFFAQHVLRLEEEPEDEEVMDPRRQGQFVHSVFEEFFTRWQFAGHREIRAANLPAARAMFAAVVDELLAPIPESEAGLERTRLLGSPAAAGLGEAVFRMEAERDVAVVERLLEYDLSGEFEIATPNGRRRVALRGKVDRIDLLVDGTFRLIDYKLGWPPDKGRALQLPIYGLCAEQRLRGRHGRSWALGEAVYLAFKGPKRVVPLFSANTNREEILARASERLLAAIDAVARGEFPPSPDDVYRCEACAFQAVCRKDYVGAV